MPEKSDIGIIPFENMLHGTVRETMQALYDNHLTILRTYDVAIHHCLAAQGNGFAQICLHPQALGQCTKKLASMGFPISSTNSTSEAMHISPGATLLLQLSAARTLLCPWIWMYRKST
ncbi:MAG: prephenate dehydratase domain-containing protein [Nanoarchaeota archaeon]